MTKLSKNIKQLKENDTINLILYCLYKLTGDESYSIISELAYTVDKDSLYNLCATFGGVTIKIPTVEEYEYMIKLLLVFQMVEVDGIEFTEACNQLGISDVKKLYLDYKKLNETIRGYINE